MFRSLHMKLVLIMLLLITSLMAVVGAFLMTSVTNFYIDNFYSQMGETFGESNADFVNSLRAEAAQEGGVAVMQSMLETYSGTLGIDSRSRNYYILDAASGECLATSDELGGEKLEQTANLLTARNGQVGDESDIAAGYMDVAIPISGGDNSYIIYIRDNRSTVSSLNSELLIIILQALLVGLLISVLLSFLLSKTMINPIEKLTEGAERVASGDFSEKLEVDSTDEIGILTTTFNDMASVLHSTLEAVEDERNKLDTLFLHMTDGVVAYDRDGALIHCNPAASELLERSADECVYAELFEPLCPFEKVMAMQRSDFVASELTVGERTVELYFAPFSDEERGGVLVVLHDVTQQRKAEERRREFVANVSHELRTPLTNIRSYAETIRDAGDELPRELENSFLDIVINESDRMTHIVQDLLTLSRLDSGRSEMNMARFDFGAAIDSVLRSIELEARRHGHELTHDYHDLPMIMGDRGRIEQVMLNVLGNAVKYTPDGGHIRVTAGTVGERVWMEAAKYGIGIVLDGVFSHTGSDSRYFNREGRYGEGGAYRDPNSPYRSWYDFDSKYKGGYRSWWGFETLPEVNEETPSFVEFITGEGGVIDTWLRRGAAGFRLDVADELPDEFIEKIRTAVKRVSPEKFLLGEVWEDATTKFGFDHRRTYLLGKGLDSVMNYPFKNSVLDFVKGKPAQQAANEILSICEHYPAPAINTALNFLSTHDTERALTVIADEPANGRGREWQSGRSVTGEAYEEGMLRLRMAYAIIYTLPGVPCLYYGDEIGMQGYRDPFNRAFFCWDSHEERLRPVLAQLAQLRHSCEAFRTGELRVLRAEDGILHYQRIGKTETAEIIVNRSEHIIVEPLASGKHTEVNPMGFTIVVEENGHNPNHSYYDIQ